MNANSSMVSGAPPATVKTFPKRKADPTKMVGSAFFMADFRISIQALNYCNKAIYQVFANIFPFLALQLKTDWHN